MAKRSPKSAKLPTSSVAELPKAELDVLACLWREGPATARRVREMMDRYRPMAHGSVVTLLVRLENRGMVVHEKGPVGKAFVFRPARKPEAMYRALVKEMLQRIFGGCPSTMLETMLAVQAPTADQLTAMKRAINEQRPTKGKKKARR